MEGSAVPAPDFPRGDRAVPAQERSRAAPLQRRQIWRLPDHRVFIDGRNEVYDTLLAELFAALGSWERWEALLARYEIDAAMLRRGQLQAVQYPPETPGGEPRRGMRAFSAAYFQPSRW